MASCGRSQPCPVAGIYRYCGIGRHRPHQFFTLQTLWRVDRTWRVRFSRLFTVIFSTNAARPYRRARDDFCSPGGAAVPSLLSKSLPLCLSHLFRYHLRACMPEQKLRPHSLTVDTAVSVCISGKRGKAFFDRHRSGALLFNLCFTHCLALWPVFWTLPFGILSACLLGTLVILLGELKRRRISLSNIPFWAAVLVIGGTGIRALQTVGTVFESVNWALTTPHEVEHFFLGKVVNDPGWLFYLFVLVIKSTPLMLPLAIVGGILLWKHRNDSEETSRHFKTGIAIVIVAMLFTVCLSTTSKKFPRYLLPAFPMLEILAAIGFVSGLKWSYNALRSCFGNQTEIAKYKKALAVLVCIGFFFIQTLPVIARHPYYGTYYNPCWKVTDITKIITVGDASGLDIAAKYLNEKTVSPSLVVQVSPVSAEFLSYYFNGYTYRADRDRGHTPDYEVVYIRDSQIGRVPQTGTLNGELEAVITLNGIDHVWIYRMLKQ